MWQPMQNTEKQLRRGCDHANEQLGRVRQLSCVSIDAREPRSREVKLRVHEAADILSQ